MPERHSAHSRHNGTPREWTNPPAAGVAALPESAYAVLEAIGEARRASVEVEAIKSSPTQAGAHNGNGKGHGDAFTMRAESPILAYGRKSLQNEVDRFAQQGEGSRHGFMIASCIRLASLVKAGALTASECLAVLKEGARSNGMGESRFGEIDDAWASGYAMANARDVSHVGTQTKQSKPTAAAAQRNGASSDREQLDYATLSDDELGLIGAKSVKEAAIDWLWKYRFAKGEMALLAGDAGLGKSSLLLLIASLITTEGGWPDGAGRAPLGSVIIVSAEDSRETTLKPRLIALGADLDRIKFVTAKTVIQRPGRPAMVNPMTLQDRPYWREILKRVPDCAMLIVDPIPSYLGRDVNDAKNAELRGIIEPFIDEVTRPAGVCFTANTHLNKNTDAKTPLHRITGSMAYGALPRNVHIVLRDRDKPERRLFVQGKCNIAPDDLPAVAYTLVKVMVPSPNGEIETAYPVFDPETVKVDLQEAMGGGSGRKRGPEPMKTTEIARFLVEFLKGRGPVFLGEIMDVAGGRRLIGEPCTDRGRPSWTNKRGLYKALDEVPNLPPPDNGWTVVTSKDDPALLSMNGKARWQLRQAHSTF